MDIECAKRLLRSVVFYGEPGRRDTSYGEWIGQAGIRLGQIILEASRRWSVPDLSQLTAPHPAAALCRAQLGDGATGHGYGEGLASLDAPEDVADMVAELLLWEIGRAHV